MKSSIWKFLPFVRPYWGRVAWAVAQVFLITGFELMKPWPLKVVIDNVLGNQPLDFSLTAGWSTAALLSLACVSLVVISLVGGLLTVLHNYTTIGVGQRMVNDLRGALYAHLQRLSLAFHGRQKVGDLMYRVTADSFAVQTMVMNGLLPIASALVLMGGMLFVLIPLDPLLTVLSLTVVPPLFMLIALFNRKISDLATEVRDNESVVYSLVQWAMSAMKVVQAFTKEEEEYRRFMGASRASLGSTLRLYSWQTLYSAIVNGVIATGTALVVYVGARSVMTGTLTVGQLIVFISYLAQLYVPINQITQSWGLIAGARIGARRCFEILETEPDLKDGTKDFPEGRAKGEVAWKDVTFRYREDMSVLRGIDLTIPAGTKVAIIGSTGAGKSTMLSLLPRFFDPSTGVVSIDGVDVREYQIKSLRQQIGMVLQPPMIFPLSVRDNIAYGRPEATEEEVIQAAKLARIHDRVMAMAQGYDTPVGEAAQTLSEGEKQRLTIARAILRDAAILILDEPTSALDVETEALVMEGIERLTEGRTTFIIAHRLSTVRSADIILVLRDGVIAEKGSFSELIRQNGIFAELYNGKFLGLTQEAE